MSGDGFLERSIGFVTHAIHDGQDPEQWESRACVVPIVTAAMYKQQAPGENQGFMYGRTGNPSRQVFEQCLASLDGAQHGLGFSCGLGATSAVAGLLNAGDHLISGDDQYGGSSNYFSQVLSRWNISTTYVNMTDLKAIERAIQKNTKMVWLETPSNPMLKVADIRALSDLVHKKNKDIIVVVDNTFLTSYFQLPLSLGADIVVYSMSKYMNGHGDVIMGGAVTNSDDLGARLRSLQNLMGVIPSPFDCYLVVRGLKTLGLRMDQHMKNGLAIARYLEGHKYVEQVMHPGLPSHPQHELSKRQCYGHSGMLSFYMKGGIKEVKLFIKSLQVFILARGLGATESLVEMPSLMSHESQPKEDRDKVGITDSLVRLSVGLEDITVLIEDLEQAFRKAFETKS